MILLILQDQKPATIEEKKIKKDRMFENPVLEFLSLSGPKIITVFHIVLSSLVLYTGYRLAENPLIWKIVLYFVGGMISWSLVEYLMHRYVFHFVHENKAVSILHHALHGHHHDVPQDQKHLFMPPVPALFILSMFFGIFYLFFWKNTWFFMAGFEIGYLAYSLIHYKIHKGVPKNKYLNKLWLHHANHHYKNDDKAFGVSSKFWDRVFGTLPEQELRKLKT